MEEGQSAGQFVYDRLKSERYLEGFWMDIEDHTSSIREIVDQTHTEEESAGSDTVSVAGSYEEF